MHDIRTKKELFTLINSIDRVILRAKRALYHFNELKKLYNNGYKEVLRPEEGYWDSVARAFLDSCAKQLSLFYDKQVSGSKNDQTNASMEYLLSQIRKNQLIQSWIPKYHHAVLLELRDDIKKFNNHPARSELNQVRNKSLAHNDLNQVLGNEKPIAIEVNKLGDLIALGTALLAKYSKIYDPDILNKVATISSIDDLVFESMSPGLSSIVIKLKGSITDKNTELQNK